MFANPAVWAIIAVLVILAAVVLWRMRRRGGPPQ